MNKKISFILISFSCALVKAVDLATYFTAALEEKDHPEIAAYLINAFPVQERAKNIALYNKSFPTTPYQPEQYLAADIKEELKKLREKNVQFEEAQSQQQAKMAELQKSSAELIIKNSDLAASVEVLKKERGELQKKLDITSQIVAETNDLRKQVQDLEQKKSLLESEKTALQKKVEESQHYSAQIAELTKQLEEIKQQKATLETDKNELQKQLEKENTEHKQAQERQKQEKEHLEKQLQKLTHDIERASNWATHISAQKADNPWKVAETFFTHEGQPGAAFINTLATFRNESGAHDVARLIIKQLQEKVLNAPAGPSIPSTPSGGNKPSGESADLD